MEVTANLWAITHAHTHTGTLVNKKIRNKIKIDKGRLYQYVDRHKELA